MPSKVLFYVGMIYGPIAACLVEAFPGRIRYTSLSLPYDVDSGVFEGLSICAATGDIWQDCTTLLSLLR
jgi:hypothetical protein